MESVIHTSSIANSAGDYVYARTGRNSAWGSSSKPT